MINNEVLTRRISLYVYPRFVWKYESMVMDKTDNTAVGYFEAYNRQPCSLKLFPNNCKQTKHPEIFQPFCLKVGLDS